MVICTNFSSGVAFGLTIASVPWAAISQSPDKYILDKYLPNGHALRDPSHMGKAAVLLLLSHWRDRQDQYGTDDAFRFEFKYNKNGMTLANYNQGIADGLGINLVHGESGDKSDWMDGQCDLDNDEGGGNGSDADRTDGEGQVQEDEDEDEEDLPPTPSLNTQDCPTGVSGEVSDGEDEIPVRGRLRRRITRKRRSKSYQWVHD